MKLWVIMNTVMLTLSLLGQLCVFFLYLRQKDRKTNIQKLMLRLQISDTFQYIAQLFILYPNKVSSQEIRIRCEISNIILQFGALSFNLQLFIMTFFAYQSFNTQHKTLKKLSHYSFLVCFVISLVNGLITYSIDSQNQIGEFVCYTTHLQGWVAFEFLLTFYTPLTLFMGLSLYYILKTIQILKRLRQVNGDLLQINAALEIFSILRLYPLIFIITWLGFIFQRYTLIFTNTHEFFQEGLFITMKNSQGWMNAAIYIYIYFKTRQIVRDDIRKQIYEIYQNGDLYQDDSSILSLTSLYSLTMSKTFSSDTSDKLQF